VKPLWEGSWGRADLGAGGLLIALGLVILIGVPGIETSFVTDPLGPRFFPTLLAIALIALSLALVVRGAAAVRRERQQQSLGKGSLGLATPDLTDSPPDAAAPARKGSDRRVLLLTFAMAGYVTVLPWVGYGVSSMVFFMGILAIAGERRPVRLVVQAGAVTGVLALLFGGLLGIELPGGFFPQIRLGG
jgi:putative tricarboxylic transport membrane protein